MSTGSRAAATLVEMRLRCALRLAASACLDSCPPAAHLLSGKLAGNWRAVGDEKPLLGGCEPWASRGPAVVRGPVGGHLADTGGQLAGVASSL